MDIVLSWVLDRNLCSDVRLHLSRKYVDDAVWIHSAITLVALRLASSKHIVEHGRRALLNPITDNPHPLAPTHCILSSNDLNTAALITRAPELRDGRDRSQTIEPFGYLTFLLPHFPLAAVIVSGLGICEGLGW